MDPVLIGHIASTAFSVAQGAFKVGVLLYDFIQDVRALDTTAREFACEVDALGSACSLVGTRVQSITQQHSRDQPSFGDDLTQSAQLWSCLERQLVACQITVGQLSDAVSVVVSSRAQKSNFMGQAWKQIKLNMRASDIEEVRNRIKSHTSSLQLTLQSVAIEVAYVIPNRVDNLLRIRLNELATGQLQLQSLQAQRNDETQGANQHEDERHILRLSERIKSSGETLYSESQAGGSVIGEPPPERVEFISSWIRDANAIEQVASVSSTELTDTPSIFSRATHSQSSYSAETSSTSNPTYAYDVDTCSNSSDGMGPDDEIAIEATQMCIAQGQEAFQKPDYAKASAILKEALKMVRELPSNRQTFCDINNLRFMLGVCTYHLEQPAVAKEALLSIVNGMHGTGGQDKENLELFLGAGLLLAHTHVKLGELERARGVCESTMQGSRRVLGKTHILFYQSLALRARIYEIQGESQRADSYARLLPSDVRESLVQTYQRLNVINRTELVGQSGSKSSPSSSPPVPPLSSEHGPVRADIEISNNNNDNSNNNKRPLMRPPPPPPLRNSQGMVLNAPTPEAVARLRETSAWNKPEQSPTLANTGKPGAFRTDFAQLALTQNSNVASVPGGSQSRELLPGLHTPHAPLERPKLLANPVKDQQMWTLRMPSGSLTSSHARYLYLAHGHLLAFGWQKTGEASTAQGLENCLSASQGYLKLDTIEWVQLKYWPKSRRLSNILLYGPMVSGGQPHWWRISEGIFQNRRTFDMGSQAREILNRIPRKTAGGREIPDQWQFWHGESSYRCILNGSVRPENFKTWSDHHDKSIKNIADRKEHFTSISTNDLPARIGWRHVSSAGHQVYEAIGQQK